MAEAGGERPEKAGPKTGKQRTIDPVDKYVGERLRERRKQLGHSQTVIGNHVGVTFQQVQKMEQAQNRIGAGRLYKLARFLEVDIPYFFYGAAYAGDPEGRARMMELLLECEETQELLRVFNEIHDPETRRKVIKIVKLMGH